MSSREEVLHALSVEIERTKQIRKMERDFNAKYGYLGQMPLVEKDDLRSNLSQILPDHLVPKNIGKLSEIMHPHTYEVEFDYSSGTDAIFPSQGSKTNFFKVSSEKAFLCKSVQRTFAHEGLGGFQAPLQATFRDPQSARQFMDKPIQLQHIGYRGNKTCYPMPMLIMPNADFEVELSSILSTDVTIPNASGKISLVFSGYRIETENAGEVFKAMFS